MWWKRRESNPIQPVDAKRLNPDGTPTESEQKSNTSSTLRDLVPNLENHESDTFQTVSEHNLDTVEDGSCGHCVAHPSERTCEKPPKMGLRGTTAESDNDADLEDRLQLVVSRWPVLSQKAKDAVLRLISADIDLA